MPHIWPLLAGTVKKMGAKPGVEVRKISFIGLRRDRSICQKIEFCVLISLKGSPVVQSGPFIKSLILSQIEAVLTC